MNSNWDDSADQRALPPQRSLARLIGLFITLATIIVLVLVIRRFVPHQNPLEPAVGQAIANLQLDPLNEVGSPLTVDDLQGKVTLINFWGPWCPPCRAEFPELMLLREKFSRQPKFQFVSVTCNFDANETDLPKTTQDFVSSKGYDLPVHRDPRLTTRKELLRLNHSEGFAYPTTVLIDQQGVIRGMWIGYHQGVVEQMRIKIDELLIEKPAIEKPAIEKPAESAKGSEQ